MYCKLIGRHREEPGLLQNCVQENYSPGVISVLPGETILPGLRAWALQAVKPSLPCGGAYGLHHASPLCTSM